jgi:hypothetical protein
LEELGLGLGPEHGHSPMTAPEESKTNGLSDAFSWNFIQTKSEAKYEGLSKNLTVTTPVTP